MRQPAVPERFDEEEQTYRKPFRVSKLEKTKGILSDIYPYISDRQKHSSSNASTGAWRR